MSDYSFMQSGFGDAINNTNIEDLEVMLSLFVSRSLEHSVKYAKICDRNGVTREDMIYALKYEVFEFFSNPNIQAEFLEMKNDYLKCKEEDEELEEELEEDGGELEEDGGELEEDDIDRFIVPDDEVESFYRVDLEKVNSSDKEFVNNMHNYYDHWDNWVPNTPIEKTLKNAIEQAYSK